MAGEFEDISNPAPHPDPAQAPALAVAAADRRFRGDRRSKSSFPNEPRDDRSLAVRPCAID